MVEAAKKYGFPDSQMLLVEGEVGILAAMKAGGAAVAVQTFFGTKEHEAKTGGQYKMTWRVPIGWFGLNVSALSAFGPSERCFPVQADDSPMNCAA